MFLLAIIISGIILIIVVKSLSNRRNEVYANDYIIGGEMDSFSEIIENVETIIQKMINTPDELPWYMSVEQLEMTFKELDKMNQIRDVKQFMPYYPKGIADSWAFDDKLGKELLKVLDYYKKL